MLKFDEFDLNISKSNLNKSKSNYDSEMDLLTKIKLTNKSLDRSEKLLISFPTVNYGYV